MIQLLLALQIQGIRLTMKSCLASIKAANLELVKRFWSLFSGYLLKSARTQLRGSAPCSASDVQSLHCRIPIAPRVSSRVELRESSELGHPRVIPRNAASRNITRQPVREFEHTSSLGGHVTDSLCRKKPRSRDNRIEQARACLNWTRLHR